MKWNLLGAVVLILVAGVAALAILGYARPHVVAEVQGKLLAPPAGDGSWVAWLEGNEDQAHLVAVRRGAARARTVLVAPGLSGLAVHRDSAFVMRRDPAAKITLLRVRLSDGAAQPLGEAPWPAEQMACDGEWLLWREERAAGLAGVPFVIAASPLTVLRARPVSADTVSTMLVLAGESPTRPRRVSLVGVQGGRAYWVERERRRTGVETVVHRVTLPTGHPEQVLREAGESSVALRPNCLLWTAPSVEAAEPMQYAALKRRTLDSAHDDVIGDWLLAGATVLASDAGIYVQDRERLWRLGNGRQDERSLMTGPGGLVATHVAGDQQYAATRLGDRLVILRRPLTWWARLRSLVGK